jgi:RND family efflux transporter MFP subunit
VTHHRLFSVNQETPNLVAQQDIDVAYAQAQSTAAQVDVQKANLLIAQQQLLEAQARERRVQDLVDFARIISPFSGIVTKRYVDVGTMVQVGTESTTQALPVVEVSEVNQLRLIFPVPESAMALIQPDASATVEIPNLHKTFNTKIWRYAGKSDAKTRTMETQIKVENQNFEIKPGMVATVRLTLEQSDDTLTVPLGAVLKNRSGASVLVITPDHRIDERQVKLGLETATKYEVVSGLSEKELVIVAGRNQLRVGDVVEPKLVTFEQIAN